MAIFQPLSLFALCALGGLPVAGSAAACGAPKALARESLFIQVNVQTPTQHPHRDPSRDTAAAGASSARGQFAPECKSYPGKRVVLVTVNAEFIEMFGNWLRFAKPFLQSTEHLHVVAEEAKAVPQLEALRRASGVDFTLERPHASLLQMSAPYDSREYGTLVWRRADHILQFVQQNCSVLYSDIDNVWKADPFREIADIQPADSQPLDLFLSRDMKDRPEYCTCLMYVQPTQRAIELMVRWRAHAGTNKNQIIFNEVLRNFQASSPSSAPRLGVLPFDRFPPGRWANESSNPAVLHANWMVGIRKKTLFMQDHGVWDPLLATDGVSDRMESSSVSATSAS